MGPHGERVSDASRTQLFYPSAVPAPVTSDYNHLGDSRPESPR